MFLSYIRYLQRKNKNINVKNYLQIDFNHTTIVSETDGEERISSLSVRLHIITSKLSLKDSDSKCSNSHSLFFFLFFKHSYLLTIIIFFFSLVKEKPLEHPQINTKKKYLYSLKNKKKKSCKNYFF